MRLGRILAIGALMVAIQAPEQALSQPAGLAPILAPSRELVMMRPLVASGDCRIQSVMSVMGG